ncbi:MAG: PASTA domain-containing protein [Cyanobacteria bacterium]|nr:PASTA domain-containing protein [Cyanobacteriota bacterium]
MHKSVRPLSIILFLPLVALLTSCAPTIPSVIGQPLADAEEKLEQSGLRVSIKRKQGFDDPSGIVVEQDPQAGKKFEKDSVISLVVTQRPILTGSFTLIDSDINRTAEGCSGRGGYYDIKASLQVVVKDEKGAIIGVGELEEDNYTGKGRGVICEFPFSIKNIPKAAFYEIEVGRRGSLKYSLDELNKANWKVDFMIS